jgi:hypothetical protein
MASSEMLRRVALVITDVSEELSASFIRVTRIGELGTMLATGQYLESHEFSTSIPFLFNVHFNIILPFASASSRAPQEIEFQVILAVTMKDAAQRF